MRALERTLELDGIAWGENRQRLEGSADVCRNRMRIAEISGGGADTSGRRLRVAAGERDARLDGEHHRNLAAPTDQFGGVQCFAGARRRAFDLAAIEIGGGGDR